MKKKKDERPRTLDECIPWAFEQGEKALAGWGGRPSCWIDGEQSYSLLWVPTYHIKLTALAEGLSATEAWAAVKEHFADGWPDWIEEHLDRKGWDEENLETEFIGNWQNITSTGNPFEHVADYLSRYKPPRFEPKGERSKEYYGKFLRLLLNMAARQGEEFFIDRKRAAKALKCSPKSFGHWFKWAVEDGILEKVEEHSAGLRCARWRLNPSWTEAALAQEDFETI